MNMDSKVYKKFADAHEPKSPLFKNSVKAFSVGGAICAFAQLLNTFYSKQLSLGKEDAGTLTSVSLILIAVILTGLGIFDVIAKFAGGGTLVPITGFANSVVSPAIDSKSEGLVLGVGAKIFSVAGPVLLYGIFSGAIYGVIYYLAGLIM